jgi:hypothetical protein
MMRSGICHGCGSLDDLPFRSDDGHYFCSEDCLAIYEEEMSEDDL